MGRAVELAIDDGKSAFCPGKEGFLGMAHELAAHVLTTWTEAEDESRQRLEVLEARHSTLRRHVKALLAAYHQLRYRLEDAVRFLPPQAPGMWCGWLVEAAKGGFAPG